MYRRLLGRVCIQSKKLREKKSLVIFLIFVTAQEIRINIAQLIFSYLKLPIIIVIMVVTRSIHFNPNLRVTNPLHKKLAVNFTLQFLSFFHYLPFQQTLSLYYLCDYFIIIV